MNFRLILNIMGYTLWVEAGCLLLPLLVSVGYGEACWEPFLWTLGLCSLCGLILTHIPARKNRLQGRDGYAVVAMAWVVLCLFGAVPYVLSGAVPHYADALFETASGLTTTGATILTDVEAMPRGILFWRALTQWMGGMGVLVLFLALMPWTGAGGVHLMRAESPGPSVGKMVPRMRQTASLLYKIYIVLTVLCVLFLLAGGMPLFDSLVHAFGTVGTGGFGIKADSIASYSPYIQGVITVFMILCGINFNLYYLLLLRQWRSVLRSDELWTYLGLVVVATGVITLDLRGVYGGLGTCLRQAAFQVGSVITTTGYATADFNVWPGLSRAILFALMFIGGCAGSTAGGLKVSRAMILLRTIRREINRLVHPRRVTAVRCDGKALGSEVQRGVSIYFALYCLCILAAFLCLSGEPFTLETNLSAVVWAPAWGRWVPPEAMRTILSCQSCCCPWPCSWAGWRSIPCWWRCPPPSGARIKKKKLCINHMLPL